MISNLWSSLYFKIVLSKCSGFPEILLQWKILWQSTMNYEASTKIKDVILYSSRIKFDPKDVFSSHRLRYGEVMGKNLRNSWFWAAVSRNCFQIMKNDWLQTIVSGLLKFSWKLTENPDRREMNRSLSVLSVLSVLSHSQLWVVLVDWTIILHHTQFQIYTSYFYNFIFTDK